MWDSIRGTSRSTRQEAARAYRVLVEADAAHAPFPDGYFASAFSNSVLEHIPHVQAVLNETARVLKPAALFLFCVPNDSFTGSLSIARSMDRLGLSEPGGSLPQGLQSHLPPRPLR